MTSVSRHIAQLNVGRLRYETDDPRMADFMNNLARINALAERSPGFVWRYTDATGNETDDPRMADFMNNLARINALAERSPGFVWRYTDATGNATDTRPYDGDPRMAINMSVWES